MLQVLILQFVFLCYVHCLIFAYVSLQNIKLMFVHSETSYASPNYSSAPVLLCHVLFGQMFLLRNFSCSHLCNKTHNWERKEYAGG